jgi:hypothetical protein
MSKHRKIRRRCLLIREKRVLETKKASEHPLCQRKAEGGLEKGLANLWSKRKIPKRAYAVRGQEIKWQIPSGMIDHLRLHGQ